MIHTLYAEGTLASRPLMFACLTWIRRSLPRSIVGDWSLPLVGGFLGRPLVNALNPASVLCKDLALTPENLSIDLLIH